MLPEAGKGKSLAKVRSPGVNTVVLVVKGASGPEVRAGPAVTTVPLWRMVGSFVRGVFLLVVEAEGPEREEGETELGALVLEAAPGSPHTCLGRTCPCLLLLDLGPRILLC